MSHVGAVIGGSLTKSVEVRLEPGREAALGQYVRIPLDDAASLLGMVTDILLRAAEPGATSWPPPAGDDPASSLLREVMLDTGVYTAIEVNPYLEVPADGSEPSRARRLPRHFAPVSLADQHTLNSAFQVGESRDAFKLGAPLGMDEVMLHVDVEKLFERSAGIFGKSGTGKSVYALQFLDALVSHARQATSRDERTVALVFDMHNDYGEYMKFEGGQRRSLKGLHRSDVALYSLERDAAGIDGQVIIGTRDIEPEDIEILQSTAYFTAAAVEVSHECRQRFGPQWIDELLADDPSPAVLRRLAFDDGDDAVKWPQVATRISAHPGSFENLRRGLRRLVRRPFVQSGSAGFSGVIDHIVATLRGGKSVVIQFGRLGSDLTSYMLVANMLSRRIWEEYRDEMEKARGETSREPNRLVIAIEEAHKFVDRSVAGQTIFGQIARELRKYNVTLLIIDQRPSQIDSEVLSQIGTKFCLQLDSDADVEALVGGMSGRAGLRQVIAALESRRQALVFGHALPMPVVVRPQELTRDYQPGASLRERLNPNANGAATSSTAKKGLFS